MRALMLFHNNIKPPPKARKIKPKTIKQMLVALLTSKVAIQNIPPRAIKPPPTINKTHKNFDKYWAFHAP